MPEVNRTADMMILNQILTGLGQMWELHYELHYKAASCPVTHVFIEDRCVAELVLIRVIKLQVVFLHETLLKLLERLLLKEKVSDNIHSAFHSFSVHGKLFIFL